MTGLITNVIMAGKTPRKPGKRVSDTKIRSILDNLDEFSDASDDSGSGSDCELSEEDSSESDDSTGESEEGNYRYTDMIHGVRIFCFLSSNLVLAFGKF